MIVPGFLTDHRSELEAGLSALTHLQPAPKVVQIDIVDGEFADALTLEASEILRLPPLPFVYDVHLMTQEPAGYLLDFEGKPEVRTAIAQVEHLSSCAEFVEQAHAMRMGAGFSLDLFTPFSSIDQDVLPSIQVVQVMGNQAGSQGQTFHPAAQRLLEEVLEQRATKRYSFEVHVDIGMNPQTIAALSGKGIDVFVVGSYLLHDLDPAGLQDRWEQLRKAQA